MSVGRRFSPTAVHPQYVVPNLSSDNSLADRLHYLRLGSVLGARTAFNRSRTFCDQSYPPWQAGAETNLVVADYPCCIDSKDGIYGNIIHPIRFWQEDLDSFGSFNICFYLTSRRTDHIVSCDRDVA